MDFHFLKMNCRIQVERPVTEMTTGTDLVAWQIELARGNLRPFEQSRITKRCWRPDDWGRGEAKCVHESGDSPPASWLHMAFASSIPTRSPCSELRWPDAVAREVAFMHPEKLLLGNLAKPLALGVREIERIVWPV